MVAEGAVAEDEADALRAKWDSGRERLSRGLTGNVVGGSRVP